MSFERRRNRLKIGIIRWRSQRDLIWIADFARIVSSQKTKTTCFYFRRSSSDASFLSISARISRRNWLTSPSAVFLTLFFLKPTLISFFSSWYFDISARMFSNSSSEILSSAKAFEILSLRLLIFESQIETVFSCFVTLREAFFPASPVITLKTPQIRPRPPSDAARGRPTPEKAVPTPDPLRQNERVPDNVLVLDNKL